MDLLCLVHRPYLARDVAALQHLPRQIQQSQVPGAKRARGVPGCMRGGFNFKNGKTPDPISDGYAHTAAFFGELPRLEELIAKEKGYFCKLGEHQWTPLMVACLAGKHEVVSWMIARGFDLEERDRCLRTAMHYACKHGQTHVVRLLIQNGAELDRMDELQKTCLVYAADSNNLDMVSCLLSGGADPDSSDQTLRTPLHYSLKWRREGLEALTQLCMSGADPNLQDLHGWTPLHHAASMGEAASCRVLLGVGGADPSVRDDDGMTPADRSKTMTVTTLLKTAPWQCYQLKRLRCMSIMSADHRGGEDSGRGSSVESLRRARHAILHHRLSQDRQLPTIDLAEKAEGGRHARVVDVLREVLWAMNSDVFTSLLTMLYAMEDEMDLCPASLWS